MAQRKLALLTALFGAIFVYLASPASSVESYELNRHFYNGVPLHHHRKHKHHGSDIDQHKLDPVKARGKWLYLISSGRKSTRYNYKLTEISLVLTRNECLEYELSCGPNAFCALTKQGKWPVCLCEERRCFEEPDEHYCGEDGQIYRNQCELRFRSCMFGTNTSFQVPDRCPSKPRYDPEVFTAECGQQRVTYEMRMKKEPTADCYQFPAGPICGSDGKVYESLCALDQANCLESTSVQPVNSKLCLKPNATTNLKYFQERKELLDEPFSACTKVGLNCHPYASCKRYKNQQIYECECESESLCNSKNNDTSTNEYVCGTDSSTYRSLCELRMNACHNNLFIEVDKHTSNCLKPQVHYDHKKAPQIISSKLRQIKNITKESCKRLQSTLQLLERNRTVDALCGKITCGSDQRVYDNRCALDQYNCLYEESIHPIDIGLCLKTNVAIKEPRNYLREGHQGIDMEMSTCQHLSITCTPYATCVRYDIPIGRGQNNNPIHDPIHTGFGCRCETTCGSETRKPTCGSDGLVYASPCELRRTACYDKQAITEVNPSNCLRTRVRFNQKDVIQIRPDLVNNYNVSFQSCNRLKLATLKIKNNELPPRACYLDSTKPVCGSDGVVYENQCALDQENCKTKTSFVSVDHKFCLKPNAPAGKYKVTEMNGIAIIRSNLSDCQDLCPQYSTCELYREQEQLKCDCKLRCDPSEKEAVCGPDGLVYSSMCELRNMYCHSKVFNSKIQADSPSSCLKIEVYFNSSFNDFIRWSSNTASGILGTILEDE